MAIYKTRWFDRWAKKQGVGRAGEERRFPHAGGDEKGSRWIFVYGFPKNARSNIDKDEGEALKALAAHLLSLTATGLGTAQSTGELMEVDCDAKNEVSDS